MNITKILRAGIIAHTPGMCPAQTVDLYELDGMAQVVELEYRRCEIHEPVELHCFSVTSGWKITLRDKNGTVIRGHAEAYPSGPYPTTEQIVEICARLIQSWRDEVIAANARTAAAQEWSKESRSIDDAAIAVNAGQLGLIEVAAALGVDVYVIQERIDLLEGERIAAEDYADLVREQHAGADSMYVTAEELARDRRTTAGSIRKLLSRAGVKAADYKGRYRTARYDKTAAESALSM